MNGNLLPEATLASARRLFPHTSQGKIYLNHAGTSPLSTRVVLAMTTYLQDRSEGKLDSYHTDLPMVSDCRLFVQKLINAESPHRIALVVNTSDAINIVANGFPWKAGDHVLLNNIEFPANVWPYINMKRLGVTLNIIQSLDGRVTPQMISDALTPKTRVVALSAVQFLSGYRADLATIGELCRSRGVMFVVDGIQAVGAASVDVQRMKIDALAAGSQKWQTGPHGTGFLYITEELQSMIQQANLGWLAVEDPWDFYNYSQSIASTARRYEGGSLNMPCLWGLHAALSTLLEFGPPAIERHILSLTGILMEELRKIPGVEILTPFPENERAGIVTFKPPSGFDHKGLFGMMKERNVTIAIREGKFRLSPHFYNSPDEMITTAALFRDCLQQSSRVTT